MLVRDWVKSMFRRRRLNRVEHSPSMLKGPELAALIPEARYLELPGNEYEPFRRESSMVAQQNARWTCRHKSNGTNRMSGSDIKTKSVNQIKDC
jgi:hypothetical protein